MIELLLLRSGGIAGDFDITAVRFDFDSFEFQGVRDLFGA
jgi:hypothetical protein